MRFKIDWASLIVGSKFIVFALFYFVFEGNFPSTSPRGAYIWRGDLTKGFLRYRPGGLIFGGAYFGILRCPFIYIHFRLPLFILCPLFLIYPDLTLCLLASFLSLNYPDIAFT